MATLLLWKVFCVLICMQKEIENAVSGLPVAEQKSEKQLKFGDLID